MARVGEYTFGEASGSTVLIDSSGAGRDGTYAGDAAPDGTGVGQFDGDGDYAVIASDPAFGLTEGTIEIDFVQNSASTGNQPYGSNAAQTLFSTDSSDFDGGGHLSIFIKSNGEIGVRHQTDIGSFTFFGGSVTPGQPVSISYSFGPSGSVLVVDGTPVDTGRDALKMAGDVEPITIGASQAQSGDGTHNNLQGFFHGSIDRVSIDNTAAFVPPPACFLRGTHILTVNGPRRVETLRPGDLVQTVDHGPQPIAHLVTQTYPAAVLRQTDRLRPIVLEAGHFANRHDLRLTRQHCVLMCAFGQPVLIRAAHLLKTGYAGVYRDDTLKAAHYTHIQLPIHGLIWAEGTIVESLYTAQADSTGLPSQPCRPILNGAEVRRAARAHALHLPDRITARHLQLAV